jgi:sec-independent protein translocase protein TatB
MFGIGTGEILLILIIAMLVIGPERMVEFAGKAGRLLAKLRMEGDKITSEFREALAVDELTQQIQNVVADVKSDSPAEQRGPPGTPRDAQPMPVAAPRPGKGQEDSPLSESGPVQARKPALAQPNLSEEAEAVDIGAGELVPEDQDVEPTVIEQAVMIEEPAAEDAATHSDPGETLQHRTADED